MSTAIPPLTDNSHFKRVVSYARPSDWAWAAGIAIGMPSAFIAMERLAPFPGISRTAYKGPLRLNIFLGLAGGFILAYSKSSSA